MLNQERICCSKQILWFLIRVEYIASLFDDKNLYIVKVDWEKHVSLSSKEHIINIEELQHDY